MTRSDPDAWLNPRLRYLALCIACGFLPSSLWAQQAAPTEGEQFFEQKIRPVLAQHCYACHSAEADQKKKLKGGLFVDFAEGLLAGGDTGPAIVKGKSAESLLVKALKYDGLEMPPTGKLPAEVVADFAKWIDLGAPDPRKGQLPTKPVRVIDLAEGRKFWSFQPLTPVAPPEVKNAAWARTPIDRFVAARHEALGLTPSGPVAKEKLIRRAYFDLVGLPPTPEQVEAFLKDDSPQAFEKIVDSLLQSEHYGLMKSAGPVTESIRSPSRARYRATSARAPGPSSG